MPQNCTVFLLQRVETRSAILKSQNLDSIKWPTVLGCIVNLSDLPVNDVKVGGKALVLKMVVQIRKIILKVFLVRIKIRLHLCVVPRMRGNNE